MKNSAKKRILSAVFAVMLCVAAFPLTAYAGGGEDATSEQPTESTVTEQEPRPLTPEGTGTVVDHVTDEDGKEFYTIVTVDGNYFYLIIDHQRDTDNVYFLNVVTENDLLALAEPSEDTGGSSIPEISVVTEPEPEPTPEAEPEPEKSGSIGSVILILLLLLAGGGAGYYFKIYRPKQEQASAADDYEEYDFEDNDENGGDWDDNDTPPWDEDDIGEDDEE